VPGLGRPKEIQVFKLKKQGVVARKPTSDKRVKTGTVEKENYVARSGKVKNGNEVLRWPRIF
jgi:hypothetical protein